MAKRAHLDWESRSPVNLKTCGAARYAMDPRTELMCAGFAFDDGPVRVVPVSHFKTADFRDVVRQLTDPSVLIVAHSAMFEYLMWKYVLCRDFGFPTIDNPAKWACTLARAAMCGFPLSLDKLGEALQLPVTKDLAGKAAMLKLSSPIGFDPLTDEPYYNEDPVLKARLLPYCAIDVEVERLADRALPEQSAAEKRVWDLDLMTNMRGIKIDRPLVTAARKLTAGLTADLNEQLYQLTGGAVSAASKIQEMKTYIRSKGVSVDSLDKNAVTALLSDPETPEIVKKVISIRQQVGKSSTAKFATALNVMADQDDRARGLQQYHGAHTGRSAGRLLQPLNFPKGIGEAEQKALVSDILLLSAEEFVAKHKHKSMAALSNVLRGIFIADKGKRLDVADFASIEAKVVFWLADDKPALEAYEKGVNLYVDMAKFIYKRDDITKHGSPLEYAVGKETILGCFTADTLVLTQRGWVPIINVSSRDWLWDGLEWVPNNGVAYQGDRSVLCLEGIGVTPEHLILGPDGVWIQAAQVAAKGKPFLQSMIDSVVCGLLDTPSAHAAASKPFVYDASVGGIRRRRSIILNEGPRLDVISVPKFRPLKLESIIGATRRFFHMMPIENDFSIGSLPQSNVVTIQKTGCLRTMEGVASSFTDRGESTERPFLNILSPCRVGTSRISKWTAEIQIRATSLATSVLRHARKIWQVADPSLTFTHESVGCAPESLTSNEKFAVYDVLNAGPRNRFTILTDAGPLIVHNCGFGMGKDKFFGNCQLKGLDITMDQSEMAIKGYRELHKPVVNLWYATERAAANAIRTPGSIQTCAGGRIAYGMSKDRRFLICRLPSYRPLFYYKPFLRPGFTPWGTECEKIYYSASDDKGRLSVFDTYGGSLVENYVQGVARDFMINGLFNVEGAGYPSILTVYDEIVSEPDENQGSLEEFMRLMCQTPSWGKGCPVTAEGFSAKRYRK